MGRNLDRTESALQFEKYYRSCIFGLLPFQFQSFKKLLPHIKKKHVTKRNNLPQPPRLRRTYSIHHLEPPSGYFEVSTADFNDSGVTDEIVSQSRMCVNAADMLVDDEQKVANNSKHFDEQEIVLHHAAMNGDGDGDSQFGDHNGFSGETYDDFFDVFQIEKRLLMKTSKKPDTADSVSAHKRVSFRRSGSFPMSSNSCNRYKSLTPSKLESKVTETWPSSSTTSSSSSSSSSSFPTSSSSTSSSSFRCSENILPRSVSCALPVYISGELATEKAAQYETDHSAFDYSSNIRRYKLSRIRRASSLNISMERYTQLFETSFRTDGKLNISRSLRLSNKDEALQAEWPSYMNKDESSIDFDQQISCSNSMALVLTDDEVQNKSDSLQQLIEEANKTSISEQDDFPEESVTLNYEQHAQNILDALVGENCLYKSPEVNNDLDEQLLYDLVKETLLDIYIVLDAYWPAPLCRSSDCRLNPLPKTEDNVTRKVISKIQKLDSVSLKTGNSMDNVVSFDLAQGDGWMNLQADAESVGLTLDEMIFEELIEELVYE